MNINRMRTTLDLPDGLVEEARAAIGFKSTTDTVIYALKEIGGLVWALDRDFERMERLQFVSLYSNS